VAIFIIFYSNNSFKSFWKQYGLDCIQEHQKIMNELEYVWFGKIGNKPDRKILNKTIKNDFNYVLLKESKKAYICQFEAYSEGF